MLSSTNKCMRSLIRCKSVICVCMMKIIISQTKGIVMDDKKPQIFELKFEVPFKNPYIIGALTIVCLLCLALCVFSIITGGFFIYAIINEGIMQNLADKIHPSSIKTWIMPVLVSFMVIQIFVGSFCIAKAFFRFSDRLGRLMPPGYEIGEDY